MAHGYGFGGKRPRFSYPTPSPLFAVCPDRFCTNCMVKLKDQQVYKNKTCFKCASAVPNATGTWDTNGWGRCPSCFITLNRIWCYCEICGWTNKVGCDAKQKRINDANKLKEAARASAITAMQNRLREVEMENAILRQKAEDAKRKDEEIEEEKLLSEVEMDDTPASFSQSSNVNLGAYQDKLVPEVGMNGMNDLDETSKSKMSQPN